ncbi:carboxymethylenebutenolidase [Malassezia brasiliensis]|uniref:Carboxymethylenebutenolidase n=1 Tax=Malassezia brasiliensis TaxID=1821822 RepID=A0AAF0DS99_9BASI|nr:carboxymethylenebutenolidase [Malassezia brasiliensis]
MSTTNKACYDLPKGSMEKVAGIDTYVTGDKSSQNAIICVYDIFGFWDTTKQGADLLAESMKTKVVMPDFLREHPWPIDGFPPRDEQEGKKFGQWLETIGNISERVKDVKSVSEALKADGASKVGLYGFCWGGKVASQLAGANSPFAGVAMIHPAFIAPEDAKSLSVPVAFFPSKDEPQNDVDGFWNNLKSAHPELLEKSQFKYYNENHHGFAAARANLEDKSNYFAFQDVYTRLADFFCTVFK